MKPLPRTACSSPTPGLRSRLHGILALAATLVAFGLPAPARASIAYGTLNNFDCVNDTGVEAHGFEIELDDVHSRDITYTYDYNHYGVPKITEDNTDPLHPKVFIRYAGTRNPDGTWTAYTAIPAGPIAPTQGHQFTNPSINFGGEHFGAGYYGAPSAVKYNWLIDDGTGTLVHGAPVMVSTPTFTYYPPAPAQPAPQVQAVIVPPPPPAPPVLQFGTATWVKDIKTSTHNNHKIELVELRDPDPSNPAIKDWANGEPAEVETEWRILQTEFAKANNPKGNLKGLPEDLPGGDEVITRRYEFYKYVGPIDAESGEAMADTVASDGIHGVGEVTYIDSFDASGEPVEVTVDLSTVVVVGEFFGAQMAGFDIAPALGLIDHIPDGELNTAYAERTVVVGGGAGFLASVSGALPDGTTLDEVTGIFSGTPTVPGVFNFTVTASDLGGSMVSKAYTVTIPGDGVAPVTYAITTSAAPVEGGTTSGGGTFNNGDFVTVFATANPGYFFTGWTENGVWVGDSDVFTFIADASRNLEAGFSPIAYTIATIATPDIGGTTSGDGVFFGGDNVTLVATPNAGYSFTGWTEDGVLVSASATYTFVADANRLLEAGFAPVAYTIVTSAAPVAGGTTSGGGSFGSGAIVTVVATAGNGYSFAGWSEGGVLVSRSASYTFSATAHRTLLAQFAPLFIGGAKFQALNIPSPIVGGATVTGEVQLAAPAPIGGATVKLISSSAGRLSVPVSVFIPAGAKSAFFPVTTSPINAAINVYVTATCGGSMTGRSVKIIPHN